MIANRGPLGLPSNRPTIDPGTMARVAAPRPGVTCASRRGTLHPHHVVDVPSRSHGPYRRELQIETLHIGNTGASVIRLQLNLNHQIPTGAPLKVDGLFGPLTEARVKQFQAEVGLAADGVVGLKTWYHLVAQLPPRHTQRPHHLRHTRGTLPGTLPVQPPTAPTPQAPAAPPAEEVTSVISWSLDERFAYVIVHTADFLLGDAKRQFLAMVTGKGLKILTGSLVVWAGGHFFGVSEFTDAFLFGVGLAFLGRAALDAVHLMKECLKLTCTASDTRDLKEAAHCLSEVVTIVGTVAFFMAFARIARSIGNRIRARRSAAAPPPTSPAVERALSTQDNVRGVEVTRSVQRLQKPTVFRHTITHDNPVASFARIARQGFMNLAPQGYKAQFGVGVYAWEANATGIGARYIDIEVPSGTAAEYLTTPGGNFYRLVPATGDTLPVKVVSHNFTPAEVVRGNQMIGSD